MIEGASIDDFAESLLGSPKDIKDVFNSQYFFGCEADDPMAAVAFDERLNPFGARIPALFASDIGHWDVPDFRQGARGGLGAGRARPARLRGFSPLHLRQSGAPLGGDEPRIL